MIRLLVVATLVSGSCTAQQLKVVASSPFTATQLTQTIQTLPNGSKVTRSTTALIARDSEGRTRREQANAVFITDVVAGVAYVLDRQTHTFSRFSIQAAPSAQPETRQTTRMIDGLAVEMTTLRHVVPVREAGNDEPLEIISEVTYSPELQEPILTRTVDPRTGETTVQLKDIKRAEPDHALFVVPADFAMADAVPR